MKTIENIWETSSSSDRCVPAADPELLAHQSDQLLVVADENDAALVVGQTHAQRLDRLDVQVIGGLVW